MQLTIGPGGVALVIFLIYILVPAAAMISVAINLRGSMRVVWLVMLIASWLFFTLVSLILSVMWFAFKRRFMYWQQRTVPNFKIPKKPPQQ